MLEKYLVQPLTTQLFPEGPHVTVRAVDASSDGELAQSWDVYRSIDEEFFGAHTLRTPDQIREQLEDTEYWRRYSLVAEIESLEGSSMIAGLASVMLPLKDNLDQVSLGIDVYPAWRGKGIGSLLRDAVRPIIEHEGRTTIMGWAMLHAEQDPSNADLPAAKLAASLGMELRAVDEIRKARLPLDRDLVDDLHEVVEASLGKYRIVTWEDEAPQEYIEAWAELLTMLDDEAPTEDVEFETSVWDAERIRAREARNVRRGAHEIVAVALAPNGTLAGHSYVEYRTDGSRLASQEDTLVLEEHRGHKLGLALKLMTHRMLTTREPRLDAITTYNNHTNSHMVAINEQLGYRLVAKEATFQGAYKKA